MEKEKKKIEVKDEPYVYNLEIHIGKLLATQNPDLDKRVRREKLGYQKSQTVEYEQVAPEDEAEKEKTKKPKQRRRYKRKRTDVKSLLCHCFQRKNGHLIDILGGTYGHCKRVLNKAAEAMKLSRYSVPALGLIRFVPEMVDLGKDENVTFTDVLEPRSRGTTRERVLYETVTDRVVQMKMLVSKTCPLTGEEISALLTAMKDYDGFGPSKRGFIKEIKVLD